MKIVSPTVTVAALAVALSACAASPENIKAANIGRAQFAYLTCPQLAQYKATLNAVYDKAADSQHNARIADAIGLIVVGVPVGSATHESLPWQISDLKGRIAAVQQLQTADNCELRQTVAAR